MGPPPGHGRFAPALIAAIVLGLGLPACSQSPPATDSAPSPHADVTATPTRPASEVPTTTPLHYVALGDSLASGLNGRPSYVDIYRRLLERRTGRTVRLTNLGRPGWSSGQLLDALRNDSRFRDAVSSADVVTWDIGGNDILRAAFESVAGACRGGAIRCLQDARQNFTRNWDAIVDELHALTSGHEVQLQTFDLYTPFVELPGVPRDEALAELARMNETIRASSKRSNIDVAAVREAFASGGHEPLIAADGVHPTAAGHSVIARLLAKQSRLPQKG